MMSVYTSPREYLSLAKSTFSCFYDFAIVIFRDGSRAQPEFFELPPVVLSDPDGRPINRHADAYVYGGDTGVGLHKATSRRREHFVNWVRERWEDGDRSTELDVDDSEWPIVTVQYKPADPTP